MELCTKTDSQKNVGAIKNPAWYLMISTDTNIVDYIFCTYYRFLFGVPDLAAKCFLENEPEMMSEIKASFHKKHSIFH